MMWLHRMVFVLSLIIVSNASLKSDYTIEYLKPFEGLRFEHVGELKLIEERRIVTLNYNLSELDDKISKFESQIKTITILFENLKNKGTKTTFFKDLTKVENKLKLQKYEIKDFAKLKRNRRNVAEAINAMSENIKNNRRYSENLHLTSKENYRKTRVEAQKLNSTLEFLRNMTYAQNDLTKEIEIRNLMTTLKTDVEAFEKELKAIHRVMINRRMDSDLFSITEFEEKLDDIEANITDGFELPFAKTIREYLNKIETNYKIKGSDLIFEMQIPIVSQEVRDLYRIQKVPARFGDRLVMLDTPWSYIANDSSYVSTLVRIDTCIKTDETYLCDVQSQMVDKTSDDCIVKSFIESSIHIESCNSSLRIVKFTELTFIKSGEGQYYFYTQENKTVKVICSGKSKFETLTSETGLISLSPGCSVLSEKSKIFAPAIVQEKKKQMSFGVAFDDEEFQKAIQKIKTPLYSIDPLVDSFQKLDDSFGLHDPNDIVVQELKSSALLPEGSLWMLLALIFVITFLGVQMYCVIRRRQAKSKSKKKIPK
jgi:hypothetical protein